MNGAAPSAGAPADPPATSAVQPLDPESAARGFTGLLEVMDRLRSPGGCAWDARQTHESLVKYLIEESYEVIEAIESDGGPAAHRQELVEELGDLLLQVVFHARVAQERREQDGGFTVSDILEAVTAKLIRRHPQVFAAEYRDTLGTQASEEALHSRWEELKKQEKPERKGPFDGVPPGLPALQYAEKILAKARRHGLEPAPGGEQPGGIPESGSEPGAPASEEELGERLFHLVRQASVAGLDPERALRATARRWAGDRERESAR
ncbi:MazG nucleotide pyrophosphohydrolase domain-containing protein [Kocuria coralli]|nr:MazG nucleotide pyrophosphohydrolase domain-containing protein [Kocuria coralli]